ncbi:MAG: serine protease [Pseudomonadales bacterium]
MTPFRALLQGGTVAFAALASLGIAGDCLRPVKAYPQARGESLEAEYARSVFRYRGGTAYFIGGKPGFLISALHVSLDSADPIEQVCSPFITSEVNGAFETESCYPVTVAYSLADLDIMILKVAAPLPESVRPLSLSTQSMERSSATYRILGYARRTESEERGYSYAEARWSQTGPVTASAGSVPLDNVTVYHVSAPQHRGASGAPLMDQYGFVWGTVVRAVDASQEAYAIPHTSGNFVRSLVEYTKPSDNATLWIGRLASTQDFEATRREFECSLDVRRSGLSSLDLIHLGNALRRRSEDRFNSLIRSPLDRATNTFIDWEIVYQIAGKAATQEEARQIAEINKETAWRLAENTANMALKRDWFARSGRYALAAAKTSEDTSSFNLLEYAEQGSETVNNALAQLTPRTIRNLDDASRAYALVYKLDKDQQSLGTSVAAGSWAIAASPNDQRGTVEVLNIINEPVGLSKIFQDFRSSLPKANASFTSEERKILLNTSQQVLMATQQPEGVLNM